MKPGAIRLLWALYFLCVIPSLVTLAHRLEFDRGFNSVALVADYVQLLELAQTENVPVNEILSRVRDEAGVTRLAILEDTPEFLELRGLCTIVEGVGWPGWRTPEEREEIERNRGREIEEAEAPSTDWPMLMGLDHAKNHLVFSDHEVFERISQVAERRYPGLVESTDLGDEGGIVSLAGEPKIVLEWGLGFDPEFVARLRQRGFTLYPRLRDAAEYPAGGFEDSFRQAAEMFPDGLLIFEGDSIVGGSRRVAAAAELIGDSELRVGWIEFAEQVGAANLSDRLPGRVARVHSIEDEEMEVITIERAVARYVRSVRERAARVVYLKPFLLAVDDLSRVNKSLGMFGNVRAALEERGFVTGEPSVIDEPVRANFLTRLAAVLALGFSLVLLIQTLGIRISIFQGWSVVILILAMWACAGWLAGWVFAQKIGVLGLAVVGPTLAIAWLAGRYDKLWSDVRNLRISPFWPTLGFWLVTVAITLAGALMISASLIDQKTLLQIDAFSGVKLALYLPILLAILIGAQIMVEPGKKGVGSWVGWLINVQLKVWHVLLGLAGLVALFVMIDRSGNFPLLSVANWENNIRGWLETAMYARPRTKEILVGHPALVLGLYLGLSTLLTRRAFMYAGLVVGAIGLTSLTNTFCHIHTPLVLSIYRTLAAGLFGGLIGLILGIIVLGIAGKVRKRIAKKQGIRYGEP